MHHDAAYDAYRNKLHVLYAFLFSSCVNICVIFQSFPHTDFTWASRLVYFGESFYYLFLINLREQNHLQYIIIGICYWTSLHSCLENPVIVSQLAPALPLLCFPIS